MSSVIDWAENEIKIACKRETDAFVQLLSEMKEGKK